MVMNMMNSYKFRMSRIGNTMGQALKQQSDVILDKTWDRDIQSKQCYIYDYWHDPDIFPELKKLEHQGRTPVDAKVLRIGSNTTSKDQTDFMIQFRPHYSCPFDLENDYTNDKYLYPETFPIGLYVDIPNADGKYEKWMIVLNNIDFQFPTYIILPCNYKFTWVLDGKKYRMWGIWNSRNSLCIAHSALY